MSALLEVLELTKLFPVRRPDDGWVERTRRHLLRHEPLTTPSLLHAVDNVSFSIAEGEAVGLVGESGCGKSTLVRLLARLIDPTAGNIIFKGQSIAVMPARLFAGTPQRAQIQMVFQDPTDSLNPRHTAHDVIAEPLRLLAGVREAGALKQRVLEAAELTGLAPELLTRYPHQLSGGQKARVGIARAIAVRPRLLILDEPTSALDVSVQAIILHLLDDLRRRLGMSYLFVSHDLNVVRLLCDRVLVMYLGKLVECGPAEQLFRSPAHPYTQALVSAVPRIEPGAAGQRLRIDGEARSPIDPDPATCRFYGRCPSGTMQCTLAAPQLREIATAHLAACHLAGGSSVAAA